MTGWLVVAAAAVALGAAMAVTSWRVRALANDITIRFDRLEATVDRTAATPRRARRTAEDRDQT